MNNENSYPIEPTRLQHKSFYMLKYGYYDGKYSKNGKESDCKYLSFGLSQWNPYDMSIKILRHTGEKWSRLSEEIPVHRFIDATILSAKIIFSDDQLKDINVEPGTFLNQENKENLKFTKRSLREKNIFKEFIEGETDDIKVVKERFSKLTDILISLRKEGKIP